MAKKKSSRKAAPAPVRKRRVRRTEEQLIADLQAKIAAVKQRAVAKEAKQEPSTQAAVSICRSIAKAADLAEAEGDTELRRSLADAHDAVGGYLTARGIRLPKPRRPRGRRPGRA